MLLLHDYWRSTAGYRVRIALGLKGLAYERAPHNLLAGEQADPAYRAINPQGLIPALAADGIVITQSMAILEWLEERHPAPPLLPVPAEDRAIVRGMATAITADIHPLNNLRVLKQLRHKHGAEQPAIDGWIAHWMAEGFSALETLVTRHGDGFAFGATPTIADCVLVPQFYSAERYGVEVAPYPALGAAVARMLALKPVQAAHPLRQSDAVA
jgi:maleylpyruvate isomerase